jgi:hypothetical protein
MSDQDYEEHGLGKVFAEWANGVDDRAAEYEREEARTEREYIESVAREIRRLELRMMDNPDDPEPKRLHGLMLDRHRDLRQRIERKVNQYQRLAAP